MPTDGDMRIRVIREPEPSQRLQITEEHWQLDYESNTWGWHPVRYQGLLMEADKVPMLIDALSSEKLVPLARVLEIVEGRMDSLGKTVAAMEAHHVPSMAKADYRAWKEINGRKCEVQLILRLLREKFEEASDESAS